jgi:hypothetical protein
MTDLLWLGVFMLACLFVLYLAHRHTDTKKQHRSVWQVLVHALYFVSRFFWAAARGADSGYLEYRTSVRGEHIRPLNEKHLGKIIRRRDPHGTRELET